MHVTLRQSKRVQTLLLVVLTAGVIASACGPATAVPRVAMTSAPAASSAPSPERSSAPLAAASERPFELVPQVGQAGATELLAFSSDSRLVITAGLDGAATLWDTASGLVVRTIALEGAAEALAVAPQGDRLYVGLANGNVDCYALRTGRRLRRLTLPGRKLGTRGMAVSPDGATLAASTQTGQVTLWDTSTWSPRELIASAGLQDHLQFSADGSSLWGLQRSQAQEDRVRRLNVATGRVEEDRVIAKDKYGGFGVVRFAPGAERLLFSITDSGAARSGVPMGDNTVLDTKTFERKPVVTQELRLVPGGSPARLLFTAFAFGGKDQYFAGDMQGYLRLAAFGADKPVWSYDPELGANRFKRRGTVMGVALSADGKRAAASFHNHEIVLFDAVDGRELAALPARDMPVGEVSFSGDGARLLLAVRGAGLRCWDLETGGVEPLLRSIRPRIDTFASAARSPRIVTLSDEPGACLSVWSTQTGQRVAELTPSACRGHVAMSDDGTTVLFAARTGKEIEVFDVDKKALRSRHSVPNPVDRLEAYGASHATVFDSAGHVLLVELGSGRILGATRAGGFDPSVLTGKPSAGGFVPTSKVLGASHDGRFIVAQDTLSSRADGLSLVSGAQPGSKGAGAVQGALVGHEGPARVAVFAPDDSLVATGGEDGTVRIWRMPKGEAESTLTGHQHRVLALAWSPDKRYLASTSVDGTVRVWRVADQASASVVVRGERWLTYSDDGYFDASHDGADLVGVSRELNAYRIDQFLAARNRPDRVLRRLGRGDPDALRFFEHRHQRRRAELKLGGESSDPLFGGAPVAALEQVQRTGDKQATLVIAVRAGAADLSHLTVFDNQVPVHAAQLSGREQRLTVKVELTAGDNVIEVSARDVAGVESLRESRSVRQEASTRPNLYYLGFGVSRYRMRALDLQYADKDAKDLEARLRQRTGYYGSVHTRTLVNEQVTRDGIARAKEFLAHARADDTVIVFVAGHGIHARDASSDYYYVTHETDPARLRETAASFDQLEGLLDGIAPRRKLLLIDTCESGEVDELERALNQAPPSAGAAPRGRRALVLDSAAATSQPAAASKPRRFLLERDRLIFGDLSRRTGAVVFASSRGWEQSYELAALENGAFTEAILETLDASILSTLPSATAEDRAFYVDALARIEAQGGGREAAQRAAREHLSLLLFGSLGARVKQRVAELTGGFQHPVVYQDNPAVRIPLPVAAPADLESIGRSLLGSGR